MTMDMTLEDTTVGYTIEQRLVMTGCKAAVEANDTLVRKPNQFFFQI